MPRRLWVGFFCALSTLTAAATAASALAAEAQGTLKTILDRGSIRRGYQKDAPPFSVAGPDGKPKGYSIDLCYRIVIGIRDDSGLPLDIEWGEVEPTTRFQKGSERE